MNCPIQYTYQAARTNHPPSKPKHPCGVCHWIHKGCSGIKGKLKDLPEYTCRRCRNELPPSPAPDLNDIVHNGESLEVVPNFCYLGDVIGSTGGCYDAITARMRSAWKSFRELLPILTNRSISLHNRGHIFNVCIRSVLLHAYETWPVTVDDLSRLTHNDNVMVRWICGTKLVDRIPMSQLHDKLRISTLDVAIRKSRLRWFGHVERMKPECWPQKILSLEITGSTPRKRWMDCVNTDPRLLRLKKEDGPNKTAWRASIKRGHVTDGV